MAEVKSMTGRMQFLKTLNSLDKSFLGKTWKNGFLLCSLQLRLFSGLKLFAGTNQTQSFALVYPQFGYSLSR